VKVTLLKQEPRLQTLPLHSATALWSLTVTATVTDPYGSDNNIFVYQINPNDDVGDRFVAVCSVSTLQSLPALKAVSSGSYYRNNMAVFLCRSMDELDTVWAKLQSDVQMLVRDWDKLHGAAVSSSVVISPDSVEVAQVIATFEVGNAKIIYRNSNGDIIGELRILEPDEEAPVTGPYTTDPARAIQRFNADRSKILYYNPAGTLIGESYISAP